MVEEGRWKKAEGSVLYQQFVDNCRVIHIFCFINENQDIR